MSSNDPSTSEEPENPKSFNVWPFTTSEFMFIRNNLKSDNLTIMEKMFRIVQMWQWRVNNSQQPIIIIDLTKLILHGLIFDRRYVIEKAIQIDDAEETAQYIYGSVLARFVNYVDVTFNQSINRHRGNMFESAASVGIPKWIVSLRHAVVHLNLPSLIELREAAIFCRNWLFDVNWSQPIEIAFISVNSHVTRPPETFEGTSAIEFKRLIKKFINLKMADLPQYQKMLRTVLLEIKAMLFSDPKHVADAIGKSFIIKTREQMKDMGFKCQEDTAWIIPGSWSVFWKDVLHIVMECSQFGNLLLCMANGILESTDPFLKVQFAAWLSFLLEKLKATGRFVSYSSLSEIAQKMIKSKKFHKKDDFVYIIESMHLSSEQNKNLIENWDKTSSCDDATIVLEQDTSDVNFALISQNSPLGLTFQQTKDTLDLSCFDC